MITKQNILFVVEFKWRDDAYLYFNYLHLVWKFVGYETEAFVKVSVIVCF